MVRALTVLCELTPPYTSQFTRTFWFHTPYSIVSVGQNTLIIPPMDCVQVQFQVAFLYFLPPGSLFFLQFSPYFFLTCLSNLALEAFSPWNLSQLLQFPSYIHLVSYYFHWFICPPPPHESVVTQDQGKDWGTFLAPVSAGQTTVPNNTPLKWLAVLMEPTGPRSAVHFKTPFTKHLTGIRSKFSLWRVVTLQIPDSFLLNFVSKPLIV